MQLKVQSYNLSNLLSAFTGDRRSTLARASKMLWKNQNCGNIVESPWIHLFEPKSTISTVSVASQNLSILQRVTSTSKIFVTKIYFNQVPVCFSCNFPQDIQGKHHIKIYDGRWIPRWHVFHTWMVSVVIQVLFWLWLVHAKSRRISIEFVSRHHVNADSASLTS